jgi:hypothetical protein
MGVPGRHYQYFFALSLPIIDERTLIMTRARRRSGSLSAMSVISSSKVANLADINAQLKSLDEEILREEVAAQHSSNEAVVPYCADVKWWPNDAPRQIESKRLPLPKSISVIGKRIC